MLWEIIEFMKSAPAAGQNHYIQYIGSHITFNTYMGPRRGRATILGGFTIVKTPPGKGVAQDGMIWGIFVYRFVNKTQCFGSAMDFGKCLCGQGEREKALHSKGFLKESQKDS